MTPRDIIEVILFLVAFIALFALAGYMETAPIEITMWLAAIVSILLWVVYILVVAYQRNKEANRPRLKIMYKGQWVDVDSPEGMVALSQVYTNRTRLELSNTDPNKE